MRIMNVWDMRGALFFKKAKTRFDNKFFGRQNHHKFRCTNSRIW